MEKIIQLDSATKETIFVAEDYDFNSFTQKQLEIICNYQLPLKTTYPKLVLMLLHNTQFNKWLHTQFSEQLEISFIVNSLIFAINDYTQNNASAKQAINIKDDDFWKVIVEPFLMYNIEKHENTNIPKNFKKNGTRKKKTKQRVRYVSI